jgi:hypothetical protein
VLFVCTKKSKSAKRGNQASCGFCLVSSVLQNVLSLRLCPFAGIDKFQLLTPHVTLCD